MSRKEQLTQEYLEDFDRDAVDLDKAILALINKLSNQIEKIPYYDLVYIFKQVLLRYFIKTNKDLGTACKQLHIKRTALVEMRKADKQLYKILPIEPHANMLKCRKHQI